jgi:hypothetical protein
MLERKISYFSNGLLIYHKNRLITRYKYKLGELLRNQMHKSIDNYNFIKLFGYVELPDNVPVNIFKTVNIFNIFRILSSILCYKNFIPESSLYKNF